MTNNIVHGKYVTHGKQAISPSRYVSEQPKTTRRRLLKTATILGHLQVTHVRQQFPSRWDEISHSIIISI